MPNSKPSFSPDGWLLDPEQPVEDAEEALAESNTYTLRSLDSPIAKLKAACRMPAQDLMSTKLNLCYVGLFVTPASIKNPD